MEPIHRDPDQFTGIIAEPLCKEILDLHAAQMLGVNACLNLARQAANAQRAA